MILRDAEWLLVAMCTAAKENAFLRKVQIWVGLNSVPEDWHTSHHCLVSCLSALLGGVVDVSLQIFDRRLPSSFVLALASNGGLERLRIICWWFEDAIAVLKGNPHLQDLSLRLSSGDQSFDSAQVISAIGSCTCLRSLELQGGRWNDKRYADSLAELIQSHPSLLRLSMSETVKVAPKIDPYQ